MSHCKLDSSQKTRKFDQIFQIYDCMILCKPTDNCNAIQVDATDLKNAESADQDEEVEDGDDFQFPDDVVDEEDDLTDDFNEEKIESSNDAKGFFGRRRSFRFGRKALAYNSRRRIRMKKYVKLRRRWGGWK